MFSTGYYGYFSDYLWWWIVLASLILHAYCFFKFTRRTERKRFRLIVGNVLIGLVLLCFVGLIAESYLRFLCVQTDSFGTTLTAKKWFAVYPQLNSLSHRDHEWAETKPEGVRRIAFVGDSFTYGWGINNREDRFTDVIQSRFDQRSLGAVEVMNVAWGGWNTRDHFKAIKQMIEKYDVDEVVLCHLPNDIETLLPTTDNFDPIKPPDSKFIRTDSSFLLDYLYHRFYAYLVPSVRDYWEWLAAGYADPAIWREQSIRYAAIMGVCQQNEVQLRVVLLPFIRTKPGSYNGQAINDQVRGVFEPFGVPVVDLQPAIEGYTPSELIVNPADHHPNEMANKLFANAIWQAFYEESIAQDTDE